MPPNARRNLNVYVTGDSRDLQRSFSEAGRSADQFAGRMDRASAASKRNEEQSGKHARSLDRLNLALGNGVSQTKLLGDAMGAIKFPALVTGAGIAAQALSSATAGVTALGSALAPLSGALAAYPALGSAAVQGLSVFNLATKNIFDAVGGLNERLDKNAKAFRELSPEAQKVAEQLDKLKAPIQDLSTVAQRNMFPGIREGLQDAQRNLPALQRIVGDTARALGDFGRSAGELVGSRAFGRDLAEQGRRNVVWMREGGVIALNLADALRNVTLAAGPLVDWMVKLGVSASEWIKAQAQAGRESGRLARFFGETRDVMESVVAIGGDLAVAFFNIARAGKPLGDDILANLVKSADAFRRWTDSARGQNAIAQYFEQARPAVFELGRLVRDVGGAFLRLGRGNQVAPLLQQIRTTLVPALEKVVDSTTRAFGPHLIAMLGQVAELFGHLAGSSGPLVVFVDTIGEGLKLLNNLLDRFPALNAAVVALAGVAGVAKALQLGAAITGLTRIRGLLATIRTEQATAAAVMPATDLRAAGAAAGRGGAIARAGQTARGAAAGLAGGLVGGLPGLALAGGIVVGPEAVRQVSHDLGGGPGRDLVAQISEQRVKAAQREARGVVDLTRRYEAARASLLRMADASDKQFRPALRKAADNIGDLTRSTRPFVSAIDRMERSTSRDLDSIRTNTRITARGIRKNFGPDTQESRELLAQNFNAAANAVKRQMDRAGHETREGVALMNHYLRAALAEYGITGKQATRYIAGNDTLTGKPLAAPGGAGAGKARGGRVKADGGWIGMPGERGQDAVPIVVGRGEAVLNRHQQAVIEGMLGDGFLDKLFSRVTTPHYMAKGGRAVGRFARGGIVSVPGFPGERAASSVIPMIEWVARTFGLTLTDAYGPGHKSPGHTRFGTAADFAGSNAAMDRAVRALVARGYLVGYDGRFGSQRWPGHGPSYVAGSNAHLHVELGGRGGAPAAAPRLGRVVFAPGMGVLSTLGQRGMDALRSGAQATLERAVGSIADVGGGPVGRGKFSKARLAALWTQAGGPPGAANLMAAIALAESGGSPSAHNPSGATGLWQILGNPFPGNAFDPLTNARMAVSKYRSQGLGAWAVYTSGAYRRYLARGGFVARAARGRRPAPRAVSGAPQRGSSESLSAANWRTSPLLTRLETAYQMNLRTPTIYDEAVTLNQIRGIWRRRYRDAVRSRDPARIQSALEGLNDVESRLNQVSEGFQQSEADAGQRVVDFLTAGAEQQRAALDAPLAGIEMRAALAGLTPDTTDDIGAATQRRDYFAGRLRGAQAAGNVPDITEFATSLKSSMDALASVMGTTTDALTDAAARDDERTKAIVDLTAEQRRTNDLYERTSRVGDPVLRQGLADMLSGNIGGRAALSSAIPAAGRVAAL